MLSVERPSRTAPATPPTTSSSPAASSSPARCSREERDGQRPHPGRPQGRHARDRRRRSRCAATTRSSASPRATSHPASTSTCTTSRRGDFARDYAFGADVQADAVRRRAGDLPGHRAPRRPRGHAQLHRHPLDRELLGHGGAHVAEQFAANRRSARRLSERRRRGRAHAQHRLRHGHRGRGHRRPAPHARRLCARTPTSRRAHHRPRLRGQPDGRAASRRRADAKASACARYDIQDKGGTAKAVAEGIAHREGDAAAGQRGVARDRAREPHRRSACSAAAPTATRASRPIRRSAPRSTCWSRTAAPRSFPRRPRSTAPSTC